jgi:protein-L-isoaspartate(D-aspartate) O-methyltransferase
VAVRDWALILIAALAAPCCAEGLAAADEHAAERARLLREIEADVRWTREALGRAALDERVLEAIETVPRHELVPPNVRRHAYENRPLPIGYGQTISQPYIVAIMTDLVEPEPDDLVLEVGTGSGYQAAILSRLVKQVCSIEIIPELAERARRDLARLGYANIRTREGDGYYGWKDCGPFDAIVVTAGASHVPPPLIEQLKPGGKLIIPVGSRFMTQQLLLVEKDAAGEVTTRHVLPVRFVPLTGGH